MRATEIDRRGFLQTAGSAAAACGLSALVGRSASADPSASEKRYKKSLKFPMVQTGGTLAEKFKLLKKLGFDGVELDSPNDLKLDDVLRARDESGLLVPGVIDSVHWKKTLSHPDPDVRAEGVAALQTALRDVKSYGGTSVLLVPGKVGEEATYDQAWARSQPAIRKAIPLAEELGIHILIENVWNDFLTDPAETARYIDELGSKMVGAYFDVGNAVRYSPPVEWIPKLGKRIVKLDIKEYSLSKGADNAYRGFDVELLEGDCNWPKVMDALEKIGYRGWGSAEVPGGGEARLKEISQRMDRIFAS